MRLWAQLTNRAMRYPAFILFLLCPLFSFGQFLTANTTPEALFGHMIGTGIEEYPEFKKEISYGYVELGMINAGATSELLGVKIEQEIGLAFYKGRLCSISFEYKNSDLFEELTNLLGKPQFADTRNDLLGELYSFVWEGEHIRISYPVFQYGPEGSQYITVEDIGIARSPASEELPATGKKQ